MEIITGRTGTPHVYAADDAEIYKLFLGDGDFLLTTGNKLQATMNGTNEVRIADGSIMMQGRLAKIRPTDGFDSLTLDIGTTNYKRVDLVVAEYNQTTTTTEEEIEGEIVTVTDVTESITLKIVKGTPDQNQFVEPSIITGNIDLGETHQMKLWAVYLDGINFDRLVDYRIVLDTAPIQTALDYAVDSIANIQSYIDGIMPNIQNELNRIMGISKIAPLTVVVAHNITASAGVLTVPSSTYTYTAGDVFVLYLNGLRVPADGYTVSAGTNALTVTLDVSTSSTYDDIEIEVWRPSNE